MGKKNLNFAFMESKRQEKISRLIQRDLSEIFTLESRNLFNSSMITVTKVVITPDLSIARIYLSLFATADKEALLTTIKTHTKLLRGQLGNRIHLQLRVIPELHFYIDDSLDYIEKIDNLLSDL
jgi:ribosome-binding factor A